MGDPVLPLPLEDGREARQALFALRDLMHEAVPGGVYRCRICGGTGPWPSEIAHGPMPGDGPHARPCRAGRGMAVLGRLVALINAHEPRAGDTPIIDGR